MLKRIDTLLVLQLIAVNIKPERILRKTKSNRLPSLVKVITWFFKTQNLGNYTFYLPTKGIILLNMKV